MVLSLFRNKIDFLIKLICSASIPRIKKITPITISIIEPTLIPFPCKAIGIAHIKPEESKIREMDPNIFIGLKNIIIFMISKTVSKAVLLDIVLDPPIRSVILI